MILLFACPTLNSGDALPTPVIVDISKNIASTTKVKRVVEKCIKDPSSLNRSSLKEPDPGLLS